MGDKEQPRFNGPGASGPNNPRIGLPLQPTFTPRAVSLSLCLRRLGYAVAAAAAAALRQEPEVFVGPFARDERPPGFPARTISLLLSPRRKSRWRFPLLAGLPLLAGPRLPCLPVRARPARRSTPPGLADLAGPRRRGWPGSRQRRWLRRWWTREAEQRPAGVQVGVEGERETRPRWGRRKAAALCTVGGGEGQGRRRCASCVCAVRFGAWWLRLCWRRAGFGCASFYCK